MRYTPEERIFPGMNIGKLTAIEERVGRRNAMQWLCQCECGNTVILSDKALRFHEVHSCGCMSNIDDMTGRRFGLYTVLGPATYATNGAPRCEVRCDCGTKKIVPVSYLRGYKGTPNCGCLRKKYSKDEKIQIGSVIGKLTVIAEAEPGPQGIKRWLCKCDCGNELLANDKALRERVMTTCGCTGEAEDLTGRKYGMLTVLSRDVNTPSGSPRWLCNCDCGNEIVIEGNRLKRTDWIPNCGCYSKKVQIENLTTHGMSDTKLFGVWLGMKARCYNPNHKRYYRYGGRGIKVCDRWLEDFQNFYDDMGESYQEGLELDRINNDGDYEKDNCHWVTPKENARNTSRNRYITTLIGKKILTDQAEVSGVSTGTISGRLKRGVPEVFSILPNPKARKLFVEELKQLFDDKAEAIWIDGEIEDSIREVFSMAEIQAKAIKDWGFGPAEITIGHPEIKTEPNPKVLRDNPADLKTTVKVEKDDEGIQVSWETRD